LPKPNDWKDVYGSYIEQPTRRMVDIFVEMISDRFPNAINRPYNAHFAGYVLTGQGEKKFYVLVASKNWFDVVLPLPPGTYNPLLRDRPSKHFYKGWRCEEKAFYIHDESEMEIALDLMEIALAHVFAIWGEPREQVPKLRGGLLRLEKEKHEVRHHPRPQKEELPVSAGGSDHEPNFRNAFDRLDEIVRQVDCARKEPEFSREVTAREARSPEAIKDDCEALRRLARLIAFSQGANSDLVEEMLDKGTFEEVFRGFDVDRVAEMDPQELIARYWHKISVIRFRRKIDSIVRCAEALRQIRGRCGSFLGLLEQSGMPRHLVSEADVERFWSAFEIIRGELTTVDMPFFRRPTTLLHLLLHVGYPCLKPDRVVMKVAMAIGLADSEREEEKLQAVRLIQQYCLRRKMTPAVVDLYLLIYGGQRWARRFVAEWFYSWR